MRPTTFALMSLAATCLVVYLTVENARLRMVNDALAEKIGRLTLIEGGLK